MTARFPLKSIVSRSAGSLAWRSDRFLVIFILSEGLNPILVELYHRGSLKRNIGSFVSTRAWLLWAQGATAMFDCMKLFFPSAIIFRCFINIWMIKHTPSLFKLKEESCGWALSWRQLSLPFLFRDCLLCVPAGFSVRQSWIERRALPIGALVGSHSSPLVTELRVPVCQMSYVFQHVALKKHFLNICKKHKTTSRTKAFRLLVHFEIK